jgi:hypothetical protein
VLYHEYILERLKSENKRLPVQEEPPKQKPVEAVLEPFKTISELPPEHMAYQWCINRKLPKKALESIFFVPKFPEFVNSCITGKLLQIENSPRLLIPFYYYDDTLIGYQGRALDDSKTRYITIHLNHDHPLIYGLDKVNLNKKFYVVEGPFDSMFLDNAIAVGSSALLAGVNKLQCNKENAVFIFDNEKRNQEILKMMDKVIKSNHQIVIWPSHIKEKDINDMVLAGRTISEVQHIIERSIYTGLTAELKFAGWK